MHERLQHWLIYLSLILLIVSCGEPVPVDCTPDEEQCTTETEGGFETGPVAGIAAGGAAVVAITAGGLGGGEDSSSSSSSSSGASNTNQNTPTLTGTLLDSAVGGVSYTTSSNLSGLTNTNGQFEYRSGDQVTFSIGDSVLGKVNGGAVVTPVELAGTNNTADRRVINISRLLQSLDQDGDPTNGISISPATRSMLAQQAFKFDIPVTEFQLGVNPFIENILKRPIIPADEAINHLHGSLNSEGRPGSIGSQDDIRQLVPGFIEVTPANVPSNQPSNPTQFNCNFAGGTVPNGGSVIAYQSPNVAAGQLCSSQTRFCNNGLLSGSYAYMSCQVQEATDCQFNGNSIANGTSVTTYQSSTVPFGQSCTSEQRFCTNGVLGGTYPFQTCSEAGPSSCTFDGSDVPHGGVVTAFLADSVSSEGSCNSQVRSCFNGVLSGSYFYSNCSQSPPESDYTVIISGGLTAFVSDYINSNQKYQIDRAGNRYVKFSANKDSQYVLSFEALRPIDLFIYHGFDRLLKIESNLVDGLVEIDGFDGDIHLIFKSSTGAEPINFILEGEVLNHRVNSPLLSVDGGASVQNSIEIQNNKYYRVSECGKSNYFKIPSSESNRYLVEFSSTYNDDVVDIYSLKTGYVRSSESYYMGSIDLNYESGFAFFHVGLPHSSSCATDFILRRSE